MNSRTTTTGQSDEDISITTRTFDVSYTIQDISYRADDVGWAYIKRSLAGDTSDKLHFHIPIVTTRAWLTTIPKKQRLYLEHKDNKVFPLTVRTLASVGSRPSVVYGGKCPRVITSKRDLRRYIVNTVDNLRDKLSPSKAFDTNTSGRSRLFDIFVQINVVEHLVPEHLELICL